MDVPSRAEDVERPPTDADLPDEEEATDLPERDALSLLGSLTEGSAREGRQAHVSVSLSSG